MFLKIVKRKKGNGMKIIWTLLILCGLIAMEGCCCLGLFNQKAQTSRARQAAELREIAEVTVTDRGILVNLKSDVLFETGETDLSPTSDRQINRLANVLKKYPEDRISVVGHTDNVGSVEDNMTLSRNRAKSVKDRLVRDGVFPKDVSSSGKGETEPLVPNDSDDHRAINRRAELRIITID
jgi:outer membrane protein OmpA-like peptidoglycan-associated protein